MKILVMSVGTWLDKGEAAMIVATAKDLRSELPEAEITILRSKPVPEIDRLRYSDYGLKVLPRLIPVNFPILSGKFKLLKPRMLKAMVILPQQMAPIVNYTLWMLLYKRLRLGCRFLIGGSGDTIQQFTEADCCIVCGGQNLTNFDPVLIATLYEIVFSKMLGKPVMIWANSLGPFNPTYIRPIVKRVLDKVDLITTREAISKTILDDMGVTAPTFLTADAAFTLPSISQKDAMMLLENKTGLTKGELMIGVSVIPWSYLGERDANNKGDRYLEALADAADYMIMKLNAHIIFFPQATAPGQDDRQVSMKVYSKIRKKSEVTVLTDDYTPAQMKGMYGCMSLLIGTRFHSCILAQSMNVPTIAIEYAGHKALAVMKLLELEDYVCHINTITTRELISKIDKIWSDRENVKKKLEKNVGVMQAESMKNVQLAVEYLRLRKRS